MMELEYFELTHPGDRQYNQDYMAHLIDSEFGLFIVADGLGGHRAGEKASQFFCDGMLMTAEKYQTAIQNDPTKVFRDWINAAIDGMKPLFDDDELACQAHTTCAVLYLDRQRVITAHCGDSRVYRMNPSHIEWRTPDHSVPQDLLSLGMITEEELAHHPEQNFLTRSINVNKEYPVEIKAYPAMEKNETFLLCSDGFWAHVKPEELLLLSDLDCSFDQINRLAKLSMYRANGNSDNLTVMMVRGKKG